MAAPMTATAGDGDDVAAEWERMAGEDADTDQGIPVVDSPSISADWPVGGAAEDGESLRDAAVRELYEGTRIAVDPAELGEPIAEHTIEFSWGGHPIVQDQVFYAVLVTSAEVSLEGLDQWEQATTDKYGWLAAAEVGPPGPGACAVHPISAVSSRLAAASDNRSRWIDLQGIASSPGGRARRRSNQTSMWFGPKPRTWPIGPCYH